MDVDREPFFGLATPLIEQRTSSRRRAVLRKGRHMAQAHDTHTIAHGAVTEPESRTPAYQAYQILHWGFVAAPLLAGLDKFLSLLTSWEKYLAPPFARLSPISPHGTMQIVGVVEIAAAIIVALKPRVGAYVVAAWLAAIIVNLLLVGGYYDVALRDFGLCLGALALGRLSETYGRSAAHR
jgi:hypothetical protein